MQTLSRRGLFVLGGSGAAAAVLGGCGGKENPRDDADAAELLGAALAAETALGAAYAEGPPFGSGGNRRPGGPQDDATTAFREASATRAKALERLIETAGGEAGAGDGPAPRDLIEAQNAAIAAYREGAGPLPETEQRSTMIAFLAAVAAELSVMSGFGVGGNRVPRAFVTGSRDEPNVAADDDTTTTTTTEEGG
jgi:hypothetical protein